jgi:hypothetical protein
MKRFSENGARPVHALGGLNTPPLGRLGALVFQPHNSDTLYWASLRAPTRIVGCALGFCPGDTGWENVYPEKRLVRGLDWLWPNGPKGLEKKSAAAPPKHDQFFALGRGCEAHPRNSRLQPRPQPGADASAIHGRTERSGCTAAEPCPLSRGSSLPRKSCPSQTKPQKQP